MLNIICGLLRLPKLLIVSRKIVRNRLPMDLANSLHRVGAVAAASLLLLILPKKRSRKLLKLPKLPLLLMKALRPLLQTQKGRSLWPMAQHLHQKRKVRLQNAAAARQLALASGLLPASQLLMRLSPQRPRRSKFLLLPLRMRRSQLLQMNRL
jgi:hypothetical protein